MNPEIGTILSNTTQRVAMGVTSEGAAFAAGTIGLIGLMMNLAAKEYDRGADIRFAENNDIRALFAELAPGIGDAALKAELEAAATAKDASLRISVLNESNYALRRTLTKAQIYAEEHGARDAERRIWAVLKAMADRRLVQLGP